MWIVLGVLVAALVVLLVVIALQPAAFQIERAAEVGASPATVFALLDDFHAWSRWSPWEKLDPSMTKAYEGAGVGATYAWEGNSKAGAGRMTMLAITPPDSLSIRLEFLKPMVATNTARFELTPTSNGTRVRWVMTGERNFGMKAFALFVNVDKLVGKDFEAGLAAMVAVVRADAPRP
ncbi:MAG: SRPBCC family protein [Myxococcales bacterium]|nr:SRPBCC family protein [Myxococcales bacterium]